MTPTATLPAPAAHAAGAALVARYLGSGRTTWAYNRQSSFRAANVAADVSLSVTRQDDDAATLADAWGLGPITPVTDLGESASRFRTRERTGWPELLDAIRVGRVGIVLVWVWDRIIRDTNDQNALIDACRDAGAVIVQTATGTIIDPENPDSVAMAKIQGVLAETEVAKTSMRVRRAHAAKSAAGQFHGGKRRFGYNAQMTELNPAESDALKDAAYRVLDGVALNAITKEWNAAGFPTSTGKVWRGQTLSRILASPYPAALTEHEGRLIAAKWPAIYDAATHDALTRFLGNPARKVPAADGVRKYALSGVLRCAECGGPMGGRTVPHSYGTAYVCPRNFCAQGPTRAIELVVRDLVIGRLSTIDASGAFVAPVDAERANARAAERSGLDAARAAMPGQLGTLSPADYAAGLASIDERLAALDAEAEADDAAARLPLRALEGLTGHPPDVTAQRFDACTLDRQRAVIGVLGAPRLARAAHKGTLVAFDPTRVLPDWTPTA